MPTEQKLILIEEASFPLITSLCCDIEASDAAVIYSSEGMACSCARHKESS